MLERFPHYSEREVQLDKEIDSILLAENIPLRRPILETPAYENEFVDCFPSDGDVTDLPEYNVNAFMISVEKIVKALRQESSNLDLEPVL
jgi:hypothetical protein